MEPEEGSPLRLSSVQDSISGWIHRLCSASGPGVRGSLIRRLPFRAQSHLRTAVLILFCVTVVTLVYLSHAVSSISSPTQFRGHLNSASPRAVRREFSPQRSVLSNSKNSKADEQPVLVQNTSMVQQQSFKLHQTKDASPPLGKAFEFNPSEEFSIVIQTFNRSDILFRVLNHYSAMGNLERIVVVWNNLNDSPPIAEWAGLGPHPVPVRFIVQQENKMRNRLQPFPEIQTSAVVIVDDDLLISARDLQFAFRVWKRFPHLIVGFFPRKHVRSKRGLYSYGSFELDSGHGNQESSFEYSMVLTGAAFVHRNYLAMFNDSSVVPKSVHQLVDDTQNCDDLAMNVMVSQYLASTGRSQCSGLYVKPIDMRNLEKESTTGFIGMWHDPSHLAERSHCLNRLAEIYGRLPLVYSDILMMPMYTEAMRCPN